MCGNIVNTLIPLLMLGQKDNKGGVALQVLLQKLNWLFLLVTLVDHAVTVDTDSRLLQLNNFLV